MEVASLVRGAVRVDGALGLASDLRVAVEFWQARASRFSVQNDALGVDTTRTWVAWINRLWICKFKKMFNLN